MAGVEYIVSCGSNRGLVADTCYAGRIPVLCSGAIMQTSGGQCTPKRDDMCITDYYGGAVYNIGRLRSVLPGYNPANTVLYAYKFDANDLLRAWAPAVYSVSGGVITIESQGSAEIVSSGAEYTVCKENYNIEDDPHWVISWHEPAMIAGSSGSVTGIVCSYTVAETSVASSGGVQA